MDKNTKSIIRRILSDIRVELGDEFDRNFERQAFFNDAWVRRKSPTRPGGTILVDTGTLRRSVRSRTTDDSITFYTDLPYAAIHNDGGEIVVTEKMKRFFWHKYYEAPISGVLWPSNVPGLPFAYLGEDSSVQGLKLSVLCGR